MYTQVQYKGDYDPKRDAASPDDNGVLMGFMHNPQTNLSELLVLDAATMRERARVTLGHRVPRGFHGKFLSQAQLAAERPRPDKP
jgi:carotenoid cleavage dioxygenase-like enzyme